MVKEINNNSVLVEVCANSVESCIAAEKGGAKRVELCAALSEGGTTPSYGMVKKARESINIALHVIIRPRGGDFLYTSDEIEEMLEDIKQLKPLGVNGFVFGALRRDGSVDIEACKRLIEASKGVTTTFHRAFDVCADREKALEEVIALGFNHVLTSGGKSTAYEGIPALKELVKQAGNRISIMPGAGVTEQNAKDIIERTGATEIHGSFKSIYKSKMEYFNTDVTMSDVAPEKEYQIERSDEKRIAAVVAALNK